MAEEKELTHAEKIDRHFKIIGKPNPFATAHSGTPAQRKGGLGSNKGAARYKRTSAEDRRKANTDGRFGYFDEVNKRYVPAFFDAMDGGGRDTRGDEFEGGIFSGMFNDLGIKPYGSQMERAMVSPNTSPIMQAVANPQSNVDPRVLTSRGYEAKNIAPPAATVMNQQVGINDALTFQSDQANPATFDQRQSAAQAEQARMAGLMQDAQAMSLKYLNTNFNDLSEAMKANVLNMVKSGI